MIKIITARYLTETSHLESNNINFDNDGGIVKYVAF